MRARWRLSLVVMAMCGLTACGQPPVAAPAPASSAASATPAAKTGKGVGEITAIDTQAHTVTIKHGAIPEIGWPAMTMTFAATPPSLLDGRKVGDTVRFDVSLSDAGASVTSLKPQ